MLNHPPLGFLDKVVIHVGTHKTGTSSIQSFLYDQQDSLRQAGILYPNAGIVGNTKTGSRHNRFVFDSNNPSHYEDLEQELIEAKPNSLVLSAEAFSSRGNEFALQKLIDFLHSKGAPSPTLLIFLRNPWYFAKSLFIMKTLAGSCRETFCQFLISHSSFFDYDSLIERLSQVHGVARVKAFFYRESQSDSLKTLLQFIERGEMHSRAIERKNLSRISMDDALEIEMHRVFNDLMISEEKRRKIEDKIGELLARRSAWSVASGEPGLRLGFKHSSMVAKLGLTAHKADLLMPPEVFEGVPSQVATGALSQAIRSLMPVRAGRVGLFKERLVLTRLGIRLKLLELAWDWRRK